MAALSTIHDVTGRRIVSSIYSWDIYGTYHMPGTGNIYLNNPPFLPPCRWDGHGTSVRWWGQHSWAGRWVQSPHHSSPSQPSKLLEFPVLSIEERWGCFFYVTWGFSWQIRFMKILCILNKIFTYPHTRYWYFRAHFFSHPPLPLRGIQGLQMQQEGFPNLKGLDTKKLRKIPASCGMP
jgi:hypothetical protein